PPFWLATATTRARLVMWPTLVVIAGSNEKIYSAAGFLARQRFVLRRVEVACSLARRYAAFSVAMYPLVALGWRFSGIYLEVSGSISEVPRGTSMADAGRPLRGATWSHREQRMWSADVESRLRLAECMASKATRA